MKAAYTLHVPVVSGDVNYPVAMRAFGVIGYNGPLTAEIVPGKTGDGQKAAAALSVIEHMQGG